MTVVVVVAVVGLKGWCAEECKFLSGKLHQLPIGHWSKKVVVVEEGEQLEVLEQWLSAAGCSHHAVTLKQNGVDTDSEFMLRLRLCVTTAHLSHRSCCSSGSANQRGPEWHGYSPIRPRSYLAAGYGSQASSCPLPATERVAESL